eukprot:6172474-Pleurochrysis_carterae.AAC.6
MEQMQRHRQLPPEQKIVENYTSSWLVCQIVSSSFSWSFLILPQGVCPAMEMRTQAILCWFVMLKRAGWLLILISQLALHYDARN